MWTVRVDGDKVWWDHNFTDIDYYSFRWMRNYSNYYINHTKHQLTVL